MIVQYDLFKSKEEAEKDALIDGFKETKASCDKVRRALFARHNELSKELFEISQRLEIIERNLCKNSHMEKENGKNQ